MAQTCMALGGLLERLPWSVARKTLDALAIRGNCRKRSTLGDLIVYRLIHLLLRPFRTPRVLNLVLPLIVRWTYIKRNCATIFHWHVLRRIGLGVFRVDRSGRTVYLRKDNGQIVRVIKKDQK